MRAELENDVADSAVSAARVPAPLAVLSTILIVASAVRDYLPALLRDDQFDHDLDQHVWWTYRFRDPELYPDDYIADFMARPFFAPPGYRWLYRIFAPIVDPQHFADALPMVLLGIAGVVAFAIGRHAAAGRPSGGLIAVALATVGHLLRERAKAGLPRAFGLPILMLGTWGLMSGRKGVTGAALVLGALFYPPSVINLGIVTVIVLGQEIWKRRRLEASDLRVLLPGVLAAGILLSSYAQKPPADIGPKITKAEALAMQEFHEFGRSRFFERDAATFYFTSSRAGLGLSLERILALGAGLLVATRLLPGAIPKIAWLHLATAGGVFALAHAVLFALHLPNRYSEGPIAVFMMLAVSGIVPRLGEWVGGKSGAGGAVGRWLGRPSVAWSLAGIVALAVAVESGLKVQRQLAKPVDRDLEAVYAELRRLPKDVLVAAHPFDASDVPLRTRRSVLVSMEVSLPYYLGYYAKIAERTRETLAAGLATDWTEIDRLHDRYGVDLFLVNDVRFTEGGHRYYMPFSIANEALWEARRGREFVLLHPPADRIVFRAGPYALVRVGPPREFERARDQ